MVICFIAALWNLIWTKVNEDQEAYLGFDIKKMNSNDLNSNIIVKFIVKFLTWVLLFSNFVPISLLVTVEMVKFAQGIFINRDPKMISTDEHKIPTHCNSSNLNEELGEIDYVFSDKTGTLT